MILVAVFTLAMVGAVAGAVLLGMELGRRRERRAGDRRSRRAFARGVQLGARDERQRWRGAEARAFEAGREVGGDELADQMTRAALEAPDFIELAWPAAARAGGTPS